MRDYELVYIVSPLVPEENLTAVAEKVTQFISSRGGEVNRVDSWGKRKLAYPIRTFREGAYFLTHFKLDPAQAPELEDSLRTAEEIIRHLVVRLDHPVQAKEAVQAKEEESPEIT